MRHVTAAVRIRDGYANIHTGLETTFADVQGDTFFFIETNLLGAGWESCDGDFSLDGALITAHELATKISPVI